MISVLLEFLGILSNQNTRSTSLFYIHESVSESVLESVSGSATRTLHTVVGVYSKLIFIKLSLQFDRNQKLNVTQTLSAHLVPAVPLSWRIAMCLAVRHSAFYADRSVSAISVTCALIETNFKQSLFNSQLLLISFTLAPFVLFSLSVVLLSIALNWAQRSKWHFKRTGSNSDYTV